MKAGEKLHLILQICVYQFTFFKGKSYPNDEAGSCYGKHACVYIKKTFCRLMGPINTDQEQQLQN